MNALLFCKSQKLIKNNIRKLLKYEKVWILTNDFKVISYCSAYPTLYAKLYAPTEKMLAEDTYAILRSINQIISEKKLKLPNFIYEISYHIEGGVPGFYHDFLYNIKYYTDYCTDKTIDIFLCERECWIEKNVFSLLAGSRGKECKAIDDKFSFLLRIKEWLLSHSNCLQIYEIISIIITFIKYGRSKREEAFDIGVIHSSNLPSRASRQLRGISEYKDDFSVKLICYHCVKAYKRFRRQGYNADIVESYFSPHKLMKDIKSYNEDVRVLSAHLKNELAYIYYGYDISGFSYEIARRHLKNFVFTHAYRLHMVDEYVVHNKCALYTCQGNTNFIETKIFRYCVNKYHPKALFFREDRFIEAVNMESWIPYEPYSYIFDFRIYSPNNIALKRLKESGWDGEYYLCGIEKDVSNVDSSLEVYHGQDRKILLWAPSDPTSWFYTNECFIRDNEEVLNQCRQSVCMLYVKYHPGTDMFIQNDFKRKYRNCKNIIFINENEPLEPYIAKADIVITTPSLVIYDCAKNNKMCVCITDDIAKITPLERGFCVVNRVELDISTLVEKYTAERLKETVDKQNNFMNSYYYTKTELTVNDVLRKKIIEVEKKADFLGKITKEKGIF